MKEKEEENKPRILGPTGIKLVRFLKMKPVGGRIPEEKYSEWETYKNHCRHSGLKISDEGFLDMLQTHNKINKTLYPMANNFGYKPVEFKNIIIDVFLGTVSNINQDKWKKDSDHLKKEIVNGLENSLSIKLTN